MIEDTRAVQATGTRAATEERVSSTPVPLIFAPDLSGKGREESVRETPVPLVYGITRSREDEPVVPEVEGDGCGASSGGALDLTAGVALVGLVALGVGAHRRRR
ncbi:MAG: hypothetical protein F4Y50_09260 [Dehalococcoidia bacterium]|nr:hypothetical protein [Dehalococcoidia bacterium]